MIEKQLLANDRGRIPSAAKSGRPDSLRNQVAQALRAAIVAGRLNAGTVYSAPALAELFGISPTPVREAMISLVKEGLVEAVRNKGFRVLEPNTTQLHDMLELRLLIEVQTVRRIAERGVREAELLPLFPLAQETVRAANEGDIIAHVAADLRFHVELVALWGNLEITEAVRALRGRSRLAGLWSQANRDLMVSSSHEHLHILDLIRRRDDSEAEALMNRHISRAGSLWAAAVEARRPTGPPGA